MAEVAVVVPTYNEAANLPLLVEELMGLGVDLRLLVVDDNSQDVTQDVARKLSQTYGNISIIARPSKLGLGSALRHGLREALADGARYVITMDGDCSHDPRDVPQLLEAAKKEDSDLVQASRYIPGGGVQGMPIVRRLSSRAVNLLYHWLAGTPRETTNNFRVYSRRAASLVLERAKGRDYEFVPEAMLVVLSAGFKVGEVGTTFSERGSGSSKLGSKQAIKGVASLFTLSVQYRLGLGRFSRRSFADSAEAD